ncbi:hypothetical protein HDV05_000921 [Chytridiales sp. JEL 0842]|nr:hypothetical protein HDV05_000921 [Chytridiales sp. JEL 0842]
MTDPAAARSSYLKMWSPSEDEALKQAWKEHLGDFREIKKTMKNTRLIPEIKRRVKELNLPWDLSEIAPAAEAEAQVDKAKEDAPIASSAAKSTQQQEEEVQPKKTRGEVLTNSTTVRRQILKLEAESRKSAKTIHAAQMLADPTLTPSRKAAVRARRVTSLGIGSSASDLKPSTRKMKEEFEAIRAESNKFTGSLAASSTSSAAVPPMTPSRKEALRAKRVTGSKSVIEKLEATLSMGSQSKDANPFNIGNESSTAVPFVLKDPRVAALKGKAVESIKQQVPQQPALHVESPVVVEPAEFTFEAKVAALEDTTELVAPLTPRSRRRQTVSFAAFPPLAQNDDDNNNKEEERPIAPITPRRASRRQQQEPSEPTTEPTDLENSPEKPSLDSLTPRRRRVREFEILKENMMASKPNIIFSDDVPSPSPAKAVTGKRRRDFDSAAAEVDAGRRVFATPRSKMVAEAETPGTEGRARQARRKRMRLDEEEENVFVRSESWNVESEEEERETEEGKHFAFEAKVAVGQPGWLMNTFYRIGHRFGFGC